MTWQDFEEGRTIGTSGSESGIILADEEHSGGARITLEGKTTHAPAAITCGIYGWMFHTRFFGGAEEAIPEFQRMKAELDAILATIPPENDSEAQRKTELVVKRIQEFVEQFP